MEAGHQKNDDARQYKLARSTLLSVQCVQESVPMGWRVWRGPVPKPLEQLAMDVRDHVRSYSYGSIAKTIEYNGQTVGIFISHHSWTWRNGQLVTGICIPGCSLIVQQPAGTTAAAPDDLSVPDETAAVYGADDVPQGTNWTLVGVSASAIIGVATLFALAIKHAGRASSKGRRR